MVHRSGSIKTFRLVKRITDVLKPDNYNRISAFNWIDITSTKLEHMLGITLYKRLSAPSAMRVSFVVMSTLKIQFGVVFINSWKLLLCIFQSTGENKANPAKYCKTELHLCSSSAFDAKYLYLYVKIVLPIERWLIQWMQWTLMCENSCEKKTSARSAC